MQPILNYITTFLASMISYANKNPKQAMITIAILYGWSVCLVNEEILVAFCFFVAILYIYSATGESVTEALNERSDAIRKDLSTFLILKQENIEELLRNEESFLKTSQNIQVMHDYCKSHLNTLNESQQNAFIAIVAKNLQSKLIALRNVKKSTQPLIHSKIHSSFREAVLEQLTPQKASSSIKQCLKEFKKLKVSKK
jgi:hypothetical protein